MIQQLLTLEWKTFWKKPGTLLLIAVLFAVLFFGTYNGQRYVTGQYHEIAGIAQQDQERRQEALVTLASIETGGEAPKSGNPQMPYDMGRKIANQHLAKLPSGMAFVSVGQSPFYNSTHLISAGNSQLYAALSRDTVLSNPLNLVYSHFDLAFVFIWLLPFLVIAFSYNILSEEREQGTLRLIYSQPVSLLRFLMLKMFFRFSGQFVLTAVLTVAAMAVTGVAIEANMAGISTLLLLVLLYMFFWFMLSLAINLLAYSSHFNALLLFGCWVVLVLVLPVLLSIAGDTKFPANSRISLIQHIRESNLEISKDINAQLDAFYLDHPELAPADAKNQKMVNYTYHAALRNREAEEATLPLYLEYKTQMERQTAWTRAWRFTSPALLLQLSLDQLAQNETADFLAFQDAADEYNTIWRNLIYEKIFKDELFTLSSATALPMFSYSPGKVSAAKILRQNAPYLVLYILATLAMVGILSRRQLA